MRLIAVLLAGVAACSGGPDPSERCRNDLVPALPDPGANADLVGTVTFYEEQSLDPPEPDAGPGATAHATAAFVDRSVNDSGATPAFAFGRDCTPEGDPALCPCLGIIGRPVVRREPIPLTIESATAEGVVGGSLELTKRSAGHYMGGPQEALFEASDVAIEVVGDAPAGVVLEREGEAWEAAEVGTRRLWGAWIAPDGERFVVGSAGAAAADRGDGWEELDSGTSEDLTAMHGSDAADVWAVGGAGTALRFDGSSWTVEDTGVSARLEAVLILGSEVLAVGQGGVAVVRSGAGEWSEVDTGTTRDFYGLAEDGRGGAVAVGGQGLLLLWDGASFRDGASGVGVDLLGAWVDESGVVTAVGRGGLIVRDEGTGFEVEPSGVDRDLHAVAGRGGTLLAAGRSGLVLSRWPDGSWQVDNDPAGEDFHALALGPDGEVLAAGFSATFPSFSASGTPPEPLGEPTIEGVAGDGEVTITWEGSGEGYVDLLLSTEVEDDPSRRNRLRCIVTDDGCHSITRDAVDWLVSGTERTASVRVERHELVLTSVDDQTSVVLDLVRAVSFTASL